MPYFSNGTFDAVHTMDVTQPITVYFPDASSTWTSAYLQYSGDSFGFVPLSPGQTSFEIPADSFSLSNDNSISLTYTNRVVVGTERFGGTAQASATYEAYTAFEFSFGSGSVPEPASLVLACAGLGGLAIFRRRF